jgi:predicted ribosome quality control (RQC) complex YloA/Tae2 family protein
MNITDYSEVWSTNDDINDDDDHTDTPVDDTDSASNSNDDDTNEDDDDEDEEDDPFKETYEQWSRAVDQALTALNKKETSLQSEWSKAQDVEALVQRAQLLVSNLYLFTPGVTTATVVDWEQGDEGEEVTLTLNTKKYDSASAEADALFAQARKLKRGSQVISQLLEETRNAKEVLESAQLDLQSVVVATTNDDDDDDDDDSCGSPMTTTSFDEGRFGLVKDRLIRTASITKFQIPTDSFASSSKQQASQSSSSKRRDRKPGLGSPASNIRKLTSPGGCTVLVGRNRRGNEYLSLNLARGDDIWMHSRGCPGAHVLVMNRRGGPKVTDSCLQFAADLAIFYSDLRNENKAEVTAAEPKHILKPRGAPLGAVKIREEWKTFVGRPDYVPDDLKEARDQSGQTDEYHLQDKAVHRRRTREAAEENRQGRLKRKRERKKEQ